MTCLTCKPRESINGLYTQLVYSILTKMDPVRAMPTIMTRSDTDLEVFNIFLVLPINKCWAYASTAANQEHGLR